MTTIATIGAGHIGTAVARIALAAGYDVVLSNSRGPETLTDLVAELGPGATADTSAGAAAQGDLVVVTIPLHAIDDVPVEPLTGKVVIDTNNYYSARDGQIAELDDHLGTSAGLLQRHLPTSKVVKAFNHIGAADITTDGSPSGTPGRRALVVSSDHPDAADFARDLYDRIGFDTVDVSPLSESWRVERDRPAYVVKQTKAELEANLAKATRTV